MRAIFAFLLVLITFSCNTNNTPDINYTVSHQVIDSVASLKIKTHFKASPSGKTILLLQDQAWGEDSLQNALTSMKLLHTKGTITKKRDSNWIEIDHPKDVKTLDFEYTIQQDTKAPLTSAKTYRPIVQPNYFHFFSHNVFVLPQHLMETKEEGFDVEIYWKGFSENFALQNSFGTQEQRQLLENISEEEFHSAVFVGGDFRIHKMTIQDNTVAFAIRENWEVIKHDSLLVNLLKETVSIQRDLWKDHTQKYFSVTMIPTVQERGSSFQGTGLTNSFAVNASNNEHLELEGLAYLFNHELQHNWTGHIIKNEDEEKQYWFSEGFTEYYAFKNIAANNILNQDKVYFLDKINETVRNLYTSPVNTMPNSEMTYDNFWMGGYDVQKLPYFRGALFAFYLDQKIHQDSNGERSLDDLMLAIKEDAISNDQKVNSSYFIAQANTFLKEDFTPFFNQHIEKGDLINLEEVYTQLELEFEPTSQVFDLGFEFSEDKRSIASIDQASEAYKAGLREGDVLTGRSYYMGSTTHQAEFKKLVNAKEVSVRFYPVKEAPIPALKTSTSNRNHLAF